MIATGTWWGEPGKMWRESEVACEKTRHYLKEVGPMIRRYHGRYFRADVPVENSVLDNDYHDWVSWVTPRSSFRAPKVKVHSLRPDKSARQMAKVMQLAMNRWIKDRRIEQLYSWLLVDMQFAHGCLITTQQAIPGARPSEGIDPAEPDVPGLPHSPRQYRLPPDCYFDDPLARDPEGVRFRGRLCFGLRSELFAEARAFPERGWSMEAISQLSSSTALELLGGDVDTGRDLVCWREQWVPEAKEEQGEPSGGWREHGFHGMVLTTAHDTPGGAAPKEWLRAPRMYYGPPTGPIRLFGVYYVPNSVRSLAPLMVAEEPIREANKHARVTSDSAGNYKHFVMVDKTDPKLQHVVENIGHHGVAPITGFARDKIQEVQTGGITDQLIAYGGISRDRVNRTLHMDTPTRGNVEGRGTATEVDRATQASEARVEWIDLQFRTACKGSLEDAAWFIYHDNRTRIELGPEAFEELGIPPSRQPAVMRGGVGPDDVPMAALELELEAHSQRLMDASFANQILMAMDWVRESLPVMVQFPEAEWPEIVRMVGEAFQVPNLEELVDWEAMLEHAQELKALQQGQMTGPAPIRPSGQQKAPGAMLNPRGQSLSQVGTFQSRGGRGAGGGAQAHTKAPSAGMISSRGPAAQANRTLGKLPGRASGVKASSLQPAKKA